MAQSEQLPGASTMGQSWFTTTHWSVVLAAGQTSSPAAQAALERLCRTYWYPLYAYVRRRGCSAPDAQDLTQEFFARLLADDFLNGVGAEKGKFRSFLLAAMNHFLANERDRTLAAKRGGGKQIISLDAVSPEERYQFEPASDVTAAVLFEQRWAWALLEQALKHLREECEAQGKAAQFDRLKVFLQGETRGGDYARLAPEMNMSPGAVAMAVHRLRQRYGELVRAEIANTLDNPAEIEDEMRYLLTVIGGQPRPE